MAQVQGGPGNDQLDYANGVTDGVDLIFGFGGHDGIWGRGGNDSMYGGEGGDAFFGGPGYDQMFGEAGIDRFWFANGEAADFVDGGADIDQLRLDEITTANAYVNLDTQSYRIGAGLAAYVSVEVVVGTQNSDTLIGDGGANELYGENGFDNLYGGGGADRLVGGDGDDALFGGAGRDDLEGGNGNDTFFIGNGEGFDDIDGGANTDTLTFQNLTAGLAIGVRVDLQSQVYRGVLSNPVFSFQLISVENVIGTRWADTIIGNGGSNTLSGGDGNDNLIAGFGTDVLSGGNGNDTYTMDVLDRAYDGGTGIDTVIANFSASLNDATRFTGAIENLQLTGMGNNSGTGNSLDNSLLGNRGDNLLAGLGGADRITGGGGADIFRGGAGDDTYWVDQNDIVDELTGGSGIDTIEAGFTFNLATNPRVDGIVENLRLVGEGNINGIGTAQANTIWGNAGDNSLTGGSGLDKLYGGSGNDNFVFNVVVTLANRDMIYDFNHAQDTIFLDNAVFRQVGPLGVLKASAFKLSTQAIDADDRVIYNRATGQVFYDSDGSGAANALLFATLTTKPLVAYDDFRVI